MHKPEILVIAIDGGDYIGALVERETPEETAQAVKQAVLQWSGGETMLKDLSYEYGDAEGSFINLDERMCPVGEELTIVVHYLTQY